MGEETWNLQPTQEMVLYSLKKSDIILGVVFEERHSGDSNKDDNISRHDEQIKYKNITKSMTWRFLEFVSPKSINSDTTDWLPPSISLSESSEVTYILKKIKI